MDIKDWRVLAIAVWGAGLSTYLGYYRLKERRRQVKVHLRTTSYYFQKNGEGILFDVRIVNTGFRKVKIVRGEIKRYRCRWIPIKEGLKNKLRLRVSGNLEKLPVILNTDQDSRELECSIHTRWLYGYHIQAYVYDIEGKVYKSRKIRYKLLKPKGSDNLK